MVSRRPPPAAWWLAATALWLFATPYQGIIQDARLYALMALHRLRPAAYDADIWFLGGSQDDWSLFSAPYAGLVALLGLDRGAMAMTLFSGLLFVLAAALLSRGLVRGRGRWLALLCLVSLPLCYSANDMFYVREGFASARGLAVPLSMLGVAWSIAGRRAASLAIHALAFAIHPLMALGPAAISVLLLAGRRLQAALLVLGSSVLAAIFLAGELGALRLLDGKWFDFVRHSPLVFIASWVDANLSALLAWFGLLLFAGRYGQYPVRRAYRLGALVGAIGMIASLLAERLPVLLVLQTQLWRCLWFVQVLGVVAVVDLASRYLIRSRAPYRSQALLAGLLALSLRAWLGWLLLACFIFLRAGGGRYLHALIRRTAERKAWIWGINAVLAAMLLPSYWTSLSLVFAAADAAAGASSDMARSLALSGGFGLLPLACWWTILRWPRGRRTATPILAGLATGLVAGLVQWDARTVDARYQESRYVAGGTGRLFDAWIAPGDVVYWHQNAERTWFELGTAGYASTVHCSGQVFSEQRVRMLESRLSRIVTASLDAEQIRQAELGTWRLADALQAGEPSLKHIVPDSLVSYERVGLSGAAGIRHLCGDTDLKYVVASHRMEGAFLAQDSETFAGRRRISYYLYSCDFLRRPVLGNAPWGIVAGKQPAVPSPTAADRGNGQSHALAL